MSLILNQIARTLLSVIFLYGLLVAVSFLIAPREDNSSIVDTKSPETTIYSTQPKYLFFSRGTLVNPQKRVLIVGASNANVGLRPLQVQTSVRCALVNNLAIGGSNVTEIEQAVELVHAVQSPEVRLQNTFVFGIWYGTFGDSKDRWPVSSRENAETDLELELYRYGFYRRTPEGPQSLLPPAWLPVESALIRPFIIAESLARRLTEKLRGYFFVRPPTNLTEDEREAAHFTLEERREAAAYWYTQMGRKDDISGEQFAEFESLIARLLDAHERVVVADLPIPRWHQEAVAYDSKYRQRLPGLLTKFEGREGFAFSDISGLNADDDYSDEVHPKPHLAKEWAERVGKTIGSVACPAASASRAQVGRN